MKPMTEQHLAVLRRHMVEVIDLHFDLAEEETGKAAPDERLRTALLHVPRHLFVPAQIAAAAYQDTPLPIGFDKTVSQPFIGALMLDMLEAAPGHHVLEVGTGLGYQAAVLAELGARVWSVEVVEEFAETAKIRLATLGLDQVRIRVGDGSRGWADHAPFDRILVTAAAAEPPAALIEQLAPGGRMVIPLGPADVQQLSVVTKSRDGALSTRAVVPVRLHQAGDRLNRRRRSRHWLGCHVFRQAAGTVVLDAAGIRCQLARMIKRGDMRSYPEDSYPVRGAAR